MRLTNKFYTDCMHYWVKDNTQEWLDFEHNHNFSLTINNIPDVKNQTIEFSFFIRNGRRCLCYKMFFSMHDGQFLKTEEFINSGKIVKPEEANQFIQNYTTFIIDMCEHGYLRI